MEVLVIESLPYFKILLRFLISYMVWIGEVQVYMEMPIKDFKVQIIIGRARLSTTVSPLGILGGILKTCVGNN